MHSGTFPSFPWVGNLTAKEKIKGKGTGESEKMKYQGK